MLDILYQDDELVAINKPSGLLVHRSLIDTREHEFALQLTRDQIGQRVYPVHRLDRPTSGVLLFALSSHTARAVAEQFSERGVHKQYLALVRGYADEQGHIDYPLKEQLDKIADKQADTNKEAQPAVTDYQTLEQQELPFAVGRYPSARYSLLTLTPHTGRKHQLRRHLKHIFHPIVGDTSHGDGKHNHFVREKFNCHRLMLHALKLQLEHPITKRPIHLHASVPDDMSTLLKAMGFNLSHNALSQYA
ncbi:MAG: tRNA pseudouridine(65) synthase TruC [Granulosicoccaceae bacterium]